MFIPPTCYRLQVKRKNNGVAYRPPLSIPGNPSFSLLYNKPHDTTVAKWHQLIGTHLHLNETDQRTGRVSHTHTTDMLALPFCKWTLFDSNSHCVSSPPSCSPFYCLPFFPLCILFNTNPSFQCLHSQLWWQVAVETVKLTFWLIGGWLIVDQAACCVLVCWLRACPMQIGCLPSELSAVQSC